MASVKKLKIGTRGSELALVQTRQVVAALQSAHPQVEIEIVTLSTLGDRKQGTARASDSDKQDWEIDLELALLDRSIDLAVHSGKDVPNDIEAGTELLAVLKRADPRDAFLGKRIDSSGKRLAFADLPQGARVGTASLRRKAELLRLRPDLEIIDCRGNVPTRVRKLDDTSDFVGIVLAVAGLQRLGLSDLGYEALDSRSILPAINQGTLCVQMYAGDAERRELLDPLVDRNTYVAWRAERGCCEVLQGDCNSAIGIFADVEAEQVRLRARVMSPDGVECIDVERLGDANDAFKLGQELGQQLLDLGAGEIIALGCRVLG